MEPSIQIKSFQNQVLALTTEANQNLVLEIFKFQAEQNPVYKSYINYLNINVFDIKKTADIPYLPIQFFKNKTVSSFTINKNIDQVFYSSGTTGNQASKHWVFETEFYKDISTKIFEQTFGPLANHHLLAILPSYKENSHSSLIFMINHFIKKSNSDVSGYYLKEKVALQKALKNCEKDTKKIIIWGVSYALLDLAEQNLVLNNPNIIMLETGGMKGRRQEMPKENLHAILKNSFNLAHIGSEYGMTELLSQSYSQKEGIFKENFWFKTRLREFNDPFKPIETNNYGRNGVIQIMDLANIGSCCFIETQDIGQKINENEFKILGRIDNAEMRGCNLLVN